jgi:MFS family permease
VGSDQDQEFFDQDQISRSALVILGSRIDPRVNFYYVPRAHLHLDHHHHHQSDVFPIIGAHVLGMYALVLFVGSLIDRIGRPVALAAGLLVMAVSTIGMLAFSSVFATAVLLFLLGVGWNVSFVAATAQLADLTEASERGRLIGFNDRLSAFLGAGLALLGGYALDSIGVAALAIGATAIVAAPVLWLAPRVTARSV